jgi:hypothetical protein
MLEGLTNLAAAVYPQVRLSAFQDSGKIESTFNEHPVNIQ